MSIIGAFGESQSEVDKLIYHLDDFNSDYNEYRVSLRKKKSSDVTNEELFEELSYKYTVPGTNSCRSAFRNNVQIGRYNYKEGNISTDGPTISYEPKITGYLEGRRYLEIEIDDTTCTQVPLPNVMTFTGTSSDFVSFIVSQAGMVVLSNVTANLPKYTSVGAIMALNLSADYKTYLAEFACDRLIIINHYYVDDADMEVFPGSMHSNSIRFSKMLAAKIIENLKDAVGSETIFEAGRLASAVYLQTRSTDRQYNYDEATKADKVKYLRCILNNSPSNLGFYNGVNVFRSPQFAVTRNTPNSTMVNSNYGNYATQINTSEFNQYIPVKDGIETFKSLHPRFTLLVPLIDHRVIVHEVEKCVVNTANLRTITIKLSKRKQYIFTGPVPNLKLRTEIRQLTLTGAGFIIPNNLTLIDTPVTLPNSIPSGGNFINISLLQDNIYLEQSFANTINRLPSGLFTKTYSEEQVNSGVPQSLITTYHTSCSRLSSTNFYIYIQPTDIAEANTIEAADYWAMGDAYKYMYRPMVSTTMIPHYLSFIPTGITALQSLYSANKDSQVNAMVAKDLYPDTETRNQNIRYDSIATGVCVSTRINNWIEYPRKIKLIKDITMSAQNIKIVDRETYEHTAAKVMLLDGYKTIPGVPMIAFDYVQYNEIDLITAFPNTRFKVQDIAVEFTAEGFAANLNLAVRIIRIDINVKIIDTSGSFLYER